MYLGLRACPPGAPPDARDRRILPVMALLFGLGLSNHWPLMLLVAPAFLILLWPRRIEILRRFPLLLGCALLGLLPYAWMVYLSQTPLPINFDGPLQSFSEFWFFVSRAGYRGVDISRSSNWLDKIKFFRFLGSQLLIQFAVLGTLLAGAGVANLRRTLGDRVSAFLVAAFLGPSVVLLLLLGFDYDSVEAHVFHVYPLPAYAVVALWMGLGLAWARRRFSSAPRRRSASSADCWRSFCSSGAGRTCSSTTTGASATRAPCCARYRGTRSCSSAATWMWARSAITT